MPDTQAPDTDPDLLAPLSLAVRRLIRSRRSVRRYQPQPVPQEMVLALLEAVGAGPPRRTTASRGVSVS